jgi:hypothetical protein
MSEHYNETEHSTISFRRLLRKVFFDDWPMKLIALVITLALYFGVRSEVSTATFQSVPLTLRIADNAEFINPPVQQVDVVLKGDKREIEDLIRKNDLVVYRDLTDKPIGDSVIDLTPDTVSINLPAGVTVDEVRPRQIAIKLEGVIEKDIAVKPETERSVPDGFQVYGEPVVVPQKVKVRGPASFMKTLEFVSTEKVGLENRTSDFTAKQVAVTVSNPKARVLDGVVDVIFRIGEKRGERLVSAVVKGDASGKKIMVTIEGALSVMKTIKPGDIKVEMIDDGSGLKVPQLVDLPAELQGKIEIAKPKG